MPGLLLLDTPSLYFRAFHGVPESLTAPDGTPVNAVRGLLDMIASLVRDRSPAALVACMDADWRPAFRVAAIPSYKAHRVAEEDGAGAGTGRERIPAALAPQLPVIAEVLDAVGLARVGVAGYEADDVIGAYAARARSAVEVVTGDRDLFQLVDDAIPCRVLYTVRGVRELQVVDEAFLTARYGIPGRAYAAFAALRGDPSDGLPGVPGIGEKTAAALVRRFGSVAGILAALDAGEEEGFPRGSRARLAAARDYLVRAAAVVEVVRDVPVPEPAPAVPAAPRDPERLAALARRYGLDGPVRRLLAALAGAAGAAGQPTEE